MRGLQYWRGFFVLAAAHNILGGLMLLVRFDAVLAEMGFAAASPRFLVQLLFVSVIIFGIAYAMIAADPLKSRGLIVIGLLSKIAGATMSYLAMFRHEQAADWSGPLVHDVVWAIGFAVFLGCSRPGSSQLIATPQPARVDA